MSDTQEKSLVSYAESLKITGKRVGEFIQKELATTSPRLILSSIIGYVPFGPHETDSYGILLDDGTWKSWFFGMCRKARPMVANIWFTNEARKATHKKWVLEVFGREHVEFFKGFAAKLTEYFKVEIHVRLEICKGPRLLDTEWKCG